MSRFVAIALVFCFFVAASRPASATKEFGDVFKELYMKPDENAEYAKLIKKANCLVCHQGRKRVNLNPFGQTMFGLLDHDEDKENTEKIHTVLNDVVQLHTNPDDEESPTYAQLIAASELPGGPLAVVKKDPPKKEGESDDDSEDEDSEDDDSGDEGDG